MGHDAAVGRIVAVPVGMPVGGADVDFHVAADVAAFRPEAEHGVEEVGASLQIPAARTLHSDVFAGGREQPWRAQRFVEPDALEMALGVWEGAFRVGGFSHKPARGIAKGAVRQSTGKGGGAAYSRSFAFQV